MTECISWVERIAGVDEAGRGPLAGPVTAAAVILDPDHRIEGLADSKKLTSKRRLILEQEIKDKSLAWSVASCSVEEIDEINILHATMLAMKRAVEALSIQPVRVLVDGNRCPDITIASEAVIKGDSKIAAISAASILAKEERDRVMLELDRLYPEYGYASHKGYPTRLHMEMLALHGVTEHHRKSYRPVRELL